MEQLNDTSHGDGRGEARREQQAAKISLGLAKDPFVSML
jgi:hypothetical protein